MLNWGPHLVDQPLQLAGSRVKTVYGEMKQINNPGDVEDIFYAVMKMENDITVISEWNIAAGNLPNWIVQGDRGTIIVTGNKLELYKVDLPDLIDEKTYRAEIHIQSTKEDLNIFNDKGVNIKYGDPMMVYRNVAGSLISGKEYFVSTQSALMLTEVLDSIRRSAYNGNIDFLT